MQKSENKPLTRKIKATAVGSFAKNHLSASLCALGQSQKTEPQLPTIRYSDTKA